MAVGRGSGGEAASTCGGSLRGGMFRRNFSLTARTLAGHSKWQNIKHKKARNDKERSAQNTRISHQITVAAKEGGGTDPEKNIRLATMIETALRNNLSKKVIDGAIERANPSSGNEGHSIVYEGMGPGGVAFIASAMTDNKNRTAQNVRAAFTKYGASLAPCTYLFERKGYIVLNEKYNSQFDQVFDKVLEVADDIELDESIVVYTQPGDVSAAAKSIKQHYEIDDMGLCYDPIADQAITNLDDETRLKVDKLIAALEDVDDVHSVETNLK